MSQAGPVPQKIIDKPYPLDIRDQQYQDETRQSKAYVLKSEKMPTIELVTKTQGVIGSIPSQTVRPLRQPIQDTFTPEENLSTQFKKVNEIEHSPGAFNR